LQYLRLLERGRWNGDNGECRPSLSSKLMPRPSCVKVW